MNNDFKFVIILLVFFGSTSCAQKENYYSDKIISILNIDCPKNFKLIKHDTDTGLNTSYEMFVLQFSENDFNKILSQLDTTAMIKSNRKPGVYCINIGIINKNVSSLIIDVKKQTIQYTHNE